MVSAKLLLLSKLLKKYFKLYIQLDLIIDRIDQFCWQLHYSTCSDKIISLDPVLWLSLGPAHLV